MKHETHNIPLGSWQSLISANEWIFLALFFLNLRCASSCVCYINLFRCTLRNLLYEKGLPTTGGPSNKGIVVSQKRHPALSFDSQSNR